MWSQPRKMSGADWIKSLPVDDSFAMLGIPTQAYIGFQHRGLRLLDLQEERIGLIAPHEQNHPGPRAHTAHADDLAGDVNVVVLLHEVAAVDEQGLPVVADEVSDDPLELVMRLGRQQLLRRGRRVAGC